MCYLAVDPGSAECEGGHDDVDVQEGLVEGVTDWREGGNEDDDHGNSTDHTPGCERVHIKLVKESRPPYRLVLDISPAPSVKDGHENDDTTKPSVHEIVGIKTDLEDGDERVVAARKDDEGDHVNHRQHAGPPT